MELLKKPPIGKPRFPRSGTFKTGGGVDQIWRDRTGGLKILEEKKSLLGTLSQYNIASDQHLSLSLLHRNLSDAMVIGIRHIQGLFI